MRNMNIKTFLSIFFILVITSTTFSQTIEEKKLKIRKKKEAKSLEVGDDLKSCLNEMQETKIKIKILIDEAKDKYEKKRASQEFQVTLQEMNELKQKLLHLQEKWKAISNQATDEELYNIWHQPQTTLLDLITDFSTQSIYILPSHLYSLPISISSNLKIPKSASDETLDLILSSSGFGIKSINPFLKSVFILKDPNLNISSIVCEEEELNLQNSSCKVCFVMECKNDTHFTAHQFFIRFANQEITKVHLINKTLFLIGKPGDIKDLISMFKALDLENDKKVFKIISLNKLPAKEVQSILKLFFSDEKDVKNLKPGDIAPLSLDIQALEQPNSAIFLSGSKELVEKAEEMLGQIESQILDPKEKAIFHYTCKHAEPEELAQVLEHVYKLLKQEKSLLKDSKGASQGKKELSFAKNDDSKLSVEPKPIRTDSKTESKTDSIKNFVVDPKCGSIIMVIEKEFLSEIKDLIKKIDIPKKMVRIEVLLFEKKTTSEDRFGLNLLKMGSSASSSNQTNLTWQDNSANGSGKGILSFFLSRGQKNALPAFDVAYNFLLSQEDIQINACPSITTINQTPAKIALVDEISINEGVVAFDDKSAMQKDSFKRAQYGITIEITPTIHEESEGDSKENRFVTLQTDIIFDTTKSNKDFKPEVTRRNIKNQVRIQDGQTVILGGLRRKTTSDAKDFIPFLGEIPGFGKLFSETKLQDSQTEMFIFITPKIIEDISSNEMLALDDLHKRPGDLPQFLDCLNESKACSKQKLFSKTLKLLLKD
jgi:general secretion pathway protein D